MSELELEHIRAQLQSELGYDASSFPDEVLLAVLADLSIDTSGRAARAPAAPEATRAERTYHHPFDSVEEGEEYEIIRAPRARASAQRDRVYADENRCVRAHARPRPSVAVRQPSARGRARAARASFEKPT
jgi:hypothetical protein